MQHGLSAPENLPERSCFLHPFKFVRAGAVLFVSRTFAHSTRRLTPGPVCQTDVLPPSLAETFCTAGRMGGFTRWLVLSRFRRENGYPREPVKRDRLHPRARPGPPVGQPTSSTKPNHPSPQSQSLSRSYGSNLPTSLTYIILSTRGYSPRRPAADMGTS